MTSTTARGIRGGQKYKEVPMTTDRDIVKALNSIVREIHEINRRLDRLCRSSIFSCNGTEVKVLLPVEEDDNPQEKQAL